MSKARLPKSVALPEIGEHTDEVVFGNLGLPTGLDEDRVLVNLRGIDRIRTFAGLGDMSIVGYQGDTTTYEYEATGLSNDGTAVQGAKAKKRPADLSEVDIQFPFTDSQYGRPGVGLRLNSAEIKARIRENHGIPGVYDGSIYVRGLDRSLREALITASIKANLDMNKAEMALRYYGFTTIIGTLANANPVQGIINGFIFAPFMMNGLQISRDLQRVAFDEAGDDLKHWKLFRQSIFAGLSIDRVALSGIAIQSRKLIKAMY